MSKIPIEINEKTPFDQATREKYLTDIAKQSTENLRLLAKLAGLNKLQIAMIKNHPMVKKYLK